MALFPKNLPKHCNHRRLLVSKTNYGFTFIELLIVMVAMGLLFGVGFANYREYSNRKNFERAVEIVVGDLRLAQELALAGVKSDCASLAGYRVSFTGDRTYVINPACEDGSLGTAYKNVNLEDEFGTSLTLSLPVSDFVTFKNLGQGTDKVATYTITVNGGALSEAINVTTTGDVSY